MRRAKVKEPNPYHKELTEIRRVQKSDELAYVKLLVALRAKIEDDVEEQRHLLHAALANAVVQADSPRQVKLLRNFVAKWLDIPARLYLFRFESAEDPAQYFGLLEALARREAPIFKAVELAVGGEDAVQIIIKGRVSHWKAKAMKLAKTNVAKKSSPEALIISFMERQEIPSFDGRGGFTEKLPAIGRDTLFAVRDETRWVTAKTYQAIAGFIGCRPEQLHPRLPRPQRKR